MSPAGQPNDGRPSFAAGDDVPALRNEQLARIFHEIADVLEIEGELAFKIGAYRRAADSVAHTPVDVVAAYRAGIKSGADRFYGGELFCYRTRISFSIRAVIAVGGPL